MARALTKNITKSSSRTNSRTNSRNNSTSTSADPSVKTPSIEITEGIRQQLKDNGYEIVRIDPKFGPIVLETSTNKQFILNTLIEKNPKITAIFDPNKRYGYDLQSVQQGLKELLDLKTLEHYYPGLYHRIKAGDPEALELYKKMELITKGDGIPFITNGVPDPILVARAQGETGRFNLGARGDAPFNDRRKFSNSFGGYFFLTQGERAKQAAMAYSHFENPKVIQELVESVGYPKELAIRAHALSSRLHNLNKELGIKEYTMTGDLRQEISGYTGNKVLFQYANRGLLRDTTNNNRPISEALDEYTRIGEELTNMFKYSPLERRFGQIKQYLYQHKFSDNAEAIIRGTGNYNDIKDLHIVHKKGDKHTPMETRPYLNQGTYKISTIESDLGKREGENRIDKILIQGIANPIPGVDTLGVNPSTVTLIYRKGNKLCKN